MKSVDGLHSEKISPGLVRVQSFGSSQSFASAVGSSLSRNTTPQPLLVGRSPCSGLPPVGGSVCATDKKIVGSNTFNGISSNMDDCADISANLSGLNLSRNRLVDEDTCVQSQLEQEFHNQNNFPIDMSNGHTHSLQQQLIDNSEAETSAISTIYKDLAKKNATVTDYNVSMTSLDGQLNFPKRTSSSASLYTQVPSAGLEGSSVHCHSADLPNTDFAGYTARGHSINQRLNLTMNGHLDAGASLNGSIEGKSLSQSRNQVGSGLQVPVIDPLHVQYMQRTSDYAAQAAASLSDLSMGRNYPGTSHADFLEYQKANLEALLAQQKQQYVMPYLRKSGGLNHDYYGSPAFGFGMSYPGNPIGSTVLHSAGTGSPVRQNDRISCFPTMVRNSTGGSIGSWHSDNNGNIEESFASSLLEEFKNNKTRCFKLSEIVDHVFEFSADQYGSHLILQKLETASVEEKNKIFPHIIPHARTLMTDVFGNFVIQKCFEHGTESQRKELASQLTGHVLHLSLQMYGCRVIQKLWKDSKKQVEVIGGHKAYLVVNEVYQLKDGKPLWTSFLEAVFGSHL